MTTPTLAATTAFALLLATMPLSAQTPELRLASVVTQGTAVVQLGTLEEELRRASVVPDRARGHDRTVAEAVRAFYEARGFAPAWTWDGQWSETARRVMARLAAARHDGLDPADYRRPSFGRLEQSPPTTADRARAEVEFASALATYAVHATSGRIGEMRQLAPLAHAEPPQADLARVFSDILASNAPAAVLEALHPPHAGFMALRRELNRLLGSEPATSGPMASAEPIPGGPTIRLGMADARVPILRARFALAEPAGRADVMDVALMAAVRTFQQQRGLDATGTVGPQTVRALNGGREAPGTERGRDARIAQIVVNMERWRWLPRELGDIHVWVNIPEYLVRVMDGGRERFVSRTVVGTAETPTPVFSDTMTYFVVNPSWTVPPGIARRQFMPLLQSNPEALARRGIQVVRTARGGTVFRQPPGERNALGRIKFMFPNQHAIYLHDTPARGYFQRARRTFSNGCVRVDNPLAFAEAVFAREQNMTARRIEAMYGATERGVRLRHHVPVHLAYFTVEVDAAGRVATREDIYGLDQRMRALLGV